MGHCQEPYGKGYTHSQGTHGLSGTTVGSILTNLVYAGVVEALKTEAVAPRKRRKGGATTRDTRPRIPS